MVKFVYVAFLFMVLQGIFTWFQVANYKKTVQSLKNKGIMGIGVQKGKLKAGRIIILVSNEVGDIIEGKEMHGISIFARFKEIKGVQGKNIFILKNEIAEKDSKNIALMNAVDSIENSLSK